MKSAISSKGQVTVPLAVRKKLGLLPGTVVSFELVKGGALVKKGTRGTHPVDAAFGKIRLARSVDEIIDAMRGPRPKRR
jgi:AbrB family looped-hinge helix DNA binding protein